MTDEDFIEKRAVFSQFPVDILCSLFPSPLPPVRLRHHGRLFEINKDGCWLMKVVGVGRWLAKRSFCFTQITACVVPTRDGRIPQQFIQMRCREKHDGVCRNTHMVGSDRQTGWREVGQHTVRKEEGEIIDGCWLKKKKKKKSRCCSYTKKGRYKVEKLCFSHNNN